jgi:RHS repeat-associated protein
VVEGKINYVYNYTDHLGNVRLSYGLDPDAGGQLKIISENHYYPYSLKHANYNAEEYSYKENELGTYVILEPTDRQDYRYKYNGMEFQDELGLNLYDMEFRDYDPAIARWTGIDPVTHHNMSPYMAFDGNPVFWADPSGADSIGGNALDVFGRDRFDSSGMYIPFADRGVGSFDEYLSQDGGGANVGAWKAEQNENGTYVTFTWQTENIFDKNGNLKDGYFSQALLFFDYGTFDKESNFNMGTASVWALLGNGEVSVFEATTYPADDSKHAVIRDGLYIAKWGLHKGEGPALNLYNTIDGSNRIPIIQAIHPNPDFRSQYDNVLGAYATGINIHWAYPGSKGYTTGFDSKGSACSIGCLLVRGTKKEYHRDFTSILNQKQNLGVILLRFPTN